MINRHSRKKDGKSLMAHCIASEPATEKQAARVATLSMTKNCAISSLRLNGKSRRAGTAEDSTLAQEIPNEPIWKSAPETHIFHKDRHPDAKLGVNGNRMAGALYDLQRRPLVRPGRFATRGLLARLPRDGDRLDLCAVGCDLVAMVRSSPGT